MTLTRNFEDQLSSFHYDIYPKLHQPPPECIPEVIDAQTSIRWGSIHDTNAKLCDTKHDTPMAINLGAYTRF
jgi:hypothetical protein